MKASIASFVLASTIALASCGSVDAQQYFSFSSGTPTWVDDGMTANWSTTSGGPYASPWVDGNDAHFEGTGGAVDVNGTIGSASGPSGLFFDVTGYSLNADPVNGGFISSLGSDGINTAAGVSAAVNVPLSLTSPQTWTTYSGATLTVGNVNISNGSNQLTIAGSGQTIINGSLGNGSGGLLMQGGTLTLNGVNSYSGTTQFNAGVLNINSANALGTGTLSISGGTIDNTSGAAVTLITSNGILLNPGSSLTFLGSNNLNLGAGLIVNFVTGAYATINVANGVLTLPGAQGTGTNKGGLTKTGSGNLVFSVPTSGTLRYTGSTTISGGALEFPTGDAPGGHFELNGGVLQLDSAGNGTVNPVTFSLQSATNTTANGINWPAGVSGGFAAQGAPWNFSVGSSNNVWGTTTNFLSTGSSLLFGSPTANAIANLTTGMSLGTTLGAPRTVYVFAGQSGNYGQLSGNLSGSGELYKDGPGDLIFSGSNTYSGGTDVHAGELYLNGNNTVAVNSTITVEDGATLGGTGTLTARNPTVNILQGGGLEGGQSGSGSLTLPSATFSGSGTITAPVTLPGLVYFDQTGGGVGLSVGTLTTNGGTAGTVFNVNGTAYPTFQGTTTTTAHLVQYTKLAGAGANFAVGNVNVNAPLGVGGVSVVNNTAQNFIDLNYYVDYAVWTGGTSSVLTDPNNFKRSDNGAPVTYADGYDLYFDDSAGSANGNITLSSTYNNTGAILPRTLCFNNNSVNYTINGSGVFNGNAELGAITSSPTLIKNGSGTVTFTGSNDLGIIYLNAGVLSFNAITANIGKKTIAPLIMNGGTLQWAMNASSGSIDGVSDTADFDVSSLGIYQNGVNIGTSCLEIANGVIATLDTENNNVNFGNHFGASPSGGTLSKNTSTGGINKIGTGTLTLEYDSNFPAQNTELYRGGTIISQGVLSFTETSGQYANYVLNGTGPITMNGGVLQWNNNDGPNTADVSSQLTMVNNVTATLDVNGNAVNFTDSIGSGSTASLVLIGSGMLTLQGASTYTGSTSVSSGTLDAAIPAALPSYNEPGNVFVGGGACLAVMTGGSTGWTSAQIDTLRGATAWTDTTSALGIDTTNGNFSYASNITDAISLTTMGSNMLTLTGTNSYAGNTNVNGGTLTIGGAGSLGSGAYAGNISIASSAVFNYNSSANQCLSGVISGSGALVQNGPGLLTLTNSNTYTGGTTVSGGTLNVPGPANLANYAGSGALTMYPGTTLTLGTGPNGWSDASIGPLLSANAATLNTAWTLAVDTTNGNLVSAISYPAAPVALLKTGTGTLTLTGTNGYSGGTTVAEGTLDVPAPASLANYASSGALTMNAGATLTLGTGPNGWSDASIGPLLSSNSASLNTAWTLDIDTTNGTLASALSYPALPMALLETGGGTLALSGSNSYTGGTFVANGTLLVMTSDSIPEGSSLTVGNASAFFGPVTGVDDARPLSIAAVPEPCTLMLLGAAGTLGLIWRRRGLRLETRGLRIHAHLKPHSSSLKSRAGDPGCCGADHS